MSISSTPFVVMVSDRTERRLNGEEPSAMTTTSIIPNTTGPIDCRTGALAATSAPVATTSSVRHRVWPGGLAAGVAASLATVAVAAVGEAAGVSLAVEGERIPLPGFAVLTMFGAIVGIVLAGAVAHWSRHPRSVFVRSTVALTALSILPDVFADATAATRLLLGFTHVVAAAIIVPAIARRLSA